MNNNNLFAAISAAFPADVSGTAIESADSATGATQKRHSWHDIEAQTARIANLLTSLSL